MALEQVGHELPYKYFFIGGGGVGARVADELNGLPPFPPNCTYHAGLVASFI